MPNLLKRQDQASQFRAMPVNEVDKSSEVVTVPSETVQFYYYNNGVQTTDAGQAIGTLVVGSFKFTNIKNTLGKIMATELDTSLAFTSTAALTEKMWPFAGEAEAVDDVSATNRLQAIMKYLTTNGNYCVDYVKGLIYVRKASTQTSLTNVTYKIETTVGSGSSLDTEVDLVEVGGVAISLGQKTMAASVPVVIASDQTITITPVENTAISSGTKVVAVPGTAEALGASTAINEVVITALLTNTDMVVIGGSTVDIATNPGNQLYAGSSISISIDNLNKVYVDAVVAGEGVSFNILS